MARRGPSYPDPASLWARDVARDPGTPAYLGLADRWLRDCLTTHERCQSAIGLSPKLPQDRLVTGSVCRSVKVPLHSNLDVGSVGAVRLSEMMMDCNVLVACALSAYCRNSAALSGTIVPQPSRRCMSLCSILSALLHVILGCTAVDIDFCGWHSLLHLPRDVVRSVFVILAPRQHCHHHRRRLRGSNPNP